MLQKLNKTCPASHMLYVTDFTAFLVQNSLIKYPKFMSPNKKIIGKITAEAETCPNFYDFWVAQYAYSRRLGMRDFEFISMTYTFFVYVSLGVNVTFVHFELKAPEIMELLNEK